MKLKSLSRAAITLLGCVSLFLATTIFADQLSSPRSNDETTARLVCDMVERYHISGGKIDDAKSAKLLKKYIEEIDPLKLYFTHEDIQSLSKYEHSLDDLVKAGDVNFAYDAYQLHLARVKQRVEQAHRIINADHDFDVDEEMTVDPEHLAWVRTDAEMQERLRKRIKYELLALKLDNLTMEQARERLHRRYDTILRAAKQTSSSETLELYLSSLTHCFDPHSSYMSPEMLEDFRIIMELSLEGIGASLKSEDGYTIVHKVVPGGAADKDGRLKVGDKILGVGQEHGEIVDVVEMKLSRVVRYIRGEKGTKVRLRVKTADGGKLVTYELMRQKVELKSSEVKGEIINTQDRLGGPANRIGVISVPSFYHDFRGAQAGADDFKSTVRDLRSVIEDFRNQGGVDLLIADLRSNGGGALSEAIEVSGLFIDQGPVVQVKQQNGRIKSHDDEEPGVVYTGPLVVLCNRMSASASEIFAGAIKDYRRGLIVGDTTTHGKGTVQNVMPVSRQLFQLLNPQDRGALKLTINQFYRVNGDSTQNRGVESDIILPSILDHIDLGESALDNALAFDSVKKADFQPLEMVNSQLISTLQKASQSRVQGDAEFGKLKADIEKYLERKHRKSISLKESTLRKEREIDKKEQKEVEAAAEEDRDDGPIFPTNFYNDEVLRIAVDYLGQLNVPRTALK